MIREWDLAPVGRPYKMEWTCVWQAASGFAFRSLSLKGRLFSSETESTLPKVSGLAPALCGTLGAGGQISDPAREEEEAEQVGGGRWRRGRKDR